MLYRAHFYSIPTKVTKMENDHVKVLLNPDELPTQYYNILPDLPIALPPPIHPVTKEPIGPEALAPLFPMEIIRQEVSANRFEPIPP